MRASAASVRTRAFAPTLIFAASRSTVRRASSKLRMISVKPRNLTSGAKAPSLLHLCAGLKACSTQTKRAAEAARVSSSSNLLFLGSLVSGLDGASEELDVSLGCVGVLAVGFELQIFIERLNGSGSGNGLAALVVGHLVHQVHALLVISFGEIRFGRHRFVEELNRGIEFLLFLSLVRIECTLVGEHGAGVEKELGGAGWVYLGSGVVFLHGRGSIAGPHQRRTAMVVVAA